MSYETACLIPPVLKVRLIIEQLEMIFFIQIDEV